MQKILTAALNYIPPVFSKRSFNKDVVGLHQQELLTNHCRADETISAIYRVKNGESTIELAVASIAPIADEIILVDNNSDDQTLALMRRIQEKLSESIDVKVFEYKNRIAVYGPGYSTRVKEAPDTSIARYYEYAYSKASSDYLLKADAGCIFFPHAIKALKEKVRSKVPVIRFRGMEMYGQLMPYEPSLVSRKEYNGFTDKEEYETISLKHPLKKYNPRAILLRPAFIQIKRIAAVPYILQSKRK